MNDLNEKQTMNAGLFTWLMIAIVAVGMNLWLYTKWGKKWLKDLNE